MNQYLCIFVIFILFFFVYEDYKLGSQCKEPEVIEFLSTQPNKNILVVGAVHGDEPGPVKGIERFINTYSQLFQNANVYFIPKANVEGLEKNTRYLPCKSIGFPLIYDINRHFGKDKTNPIINKILEIGEKCNYVIDFHEGYGFHLENPNSTIGSTIIPNENDEAKSLAHEVVDELNPKLGLEGNKRFAYYDKSNIKHTLRWYYNNTDKKYLLVELTGKLDKQPLELRNNQAFIILEIIFRKLSIIQ